MNDSISRSDAIELCAEAQGRASTKSELKGISRIWQGLLKLPPAEAEADWIPVSEGLPEEHEWVGTKQFGTTISDKVHITFDVNGERFVKTLFLQNGELSNYEKRTMDALHKGWKMIAWMPLPKPYREDGEE